MTFRLGAVVGAACASLLIAVSPSLAHHSFAAEFDQAKPITVKGTIQKLEWVNPHAYFWVDVKEADGKVVTYAFEALSPNARSHGKVGTGILSKKGEEVVVDGYFGKRRQAARRWLRPCEFEVGDARGRPKGLPGFIRRRSLYEIGADSDPARSRLSGGCGGCGGAASLSFPQPVPRSSNQAPSPQTQPDKAKTDNGGKFGPVGPGGGGQKGGGKGKAVPSGPAPKMADGKPDLQGVWTPANFSNSGGPFDLQPWASGSFKGAPR